MNVVISGDAYPGTGLKVSEKVNLMRLTQLLSMVLHSWGSSDITIYKDSSFFHIKSKL
jgi:hypothetical protein